MTDEREELLAGEELEEEAPSEDEGEEEEEAPPAPVAAAPRKGRPKGAKDKAPRRVGVAAAPPSYDAAKKPGEVPREATALAAWVDEFLRSNGRTWNDVAVQVWRTPVAVFQGPSARVNLGVFDGGVLAGYDSITPGEQLYNYLASVYHQPGTGATGPCKYEVRFYFKQGGRTIKDGELMLDHPQAVADMRNRMAQFAFHQAQRGLGNAPSNGGGGGNYQFFQSQAPQQPYQPPYAQPAPQAPYYTALPTMPMPHDIGARDVMNVLVEQLNAARKENADLRGAPPPAPVVIPNQVQAPTQDEQDARLAKLVAQSVGAALTGLGIVPAATPAPAVTPPVDPVAKLLHDSAQALMRKVVERVAGEVSSAVDPTEAEAPAAASTAIEPVKNEPPFSVKPIPNAVWKGNPVQWVEQKEGVGFVEWAMQMSAANPALAGDLLTRAAELGSGPLGRLLAAFTAAGGPVAAAAATFQPATSNGTTAGWKPQA